MIDLSTVLYRLFRKPTLYFAPVYVQPFFKPYFQMKQDSFYVALLVNNAWLLKSSSVTIRADCIQSGNFRCSAVTVKTAGADGLYSPLRELKEANPLYYKLGADGFLSNLLAVENGQWELIDMAVGPVATFPLAGGDQIACADSCGRLALPPNTIVSSSCMAGGKLYAGQECSVYCRRGYFHGTPNASLACYGDEMIGAGLSVHCKPETMCRAVQASGTAAFGYSCDGIYERTSLDPGFRVYWSMLHRDAYDNGNYARLGNNIGL